MEEIYKGFDCTRRDSRPTLRLRLKIRRFNVKPHQKVLLELDDRHAFCDPACYSWMIRSGGGTLSNDFGESTTYTAPGANKECTNNAIINVYCVMTYLDAAFINITRRMKIYNYFRIRRILWDGEPIPIEDLPDLAYGILTKEIYAQPYGGKPVKSYRGVWFLPLWNMEAAYMTRCYDCNDNFLYKVISGFGVRRYGTSPPLKELKEKWGHDIGRVFDYRTPEMKELGCCPTRISEAGYTAP